MQREKTRTALLRAAADTFSTRPYLQATIDDIIGAAGISRATFYGHFETKLALAIAIYDGTVPDWQKHFDQLADQGDWNDARIQQWIWGLADIYVAHDYVTPLVEQLMVFEGNFRERIARDRDLLIERLAQAGVRGCTAAMETGDEARLQRAKVQLLFLRIDQICGMLARADDTLMYDADSYVRALAQELRETLL